MNHKRFKFACRTHDFPIRPVKLMQQALTTFIKKSKAFAKRDISLFCVGS